MEMENGKFDRIQCQRNKESRSKGKRKEQDKAREEGTKEMSVEERLPE